MRAYISTDLYCLKDHNPAKLGTPTCRDLSSLLVIRPLAIQPFLWLQLLRARMRLFIAALLATTLCGQHDVQVSAWYSVWESSYAVSESRSDSEVPDSDPDRVDSSTTQLVTTGTMMTEDMATPGDPEAYVICDSTSMTLIVDKAQFDVGDDGGDMHFIDDSCRGYTHDVDHYAITTAYDRCSTTQKETDDYIVFSNVVTHGNQRPNERTKGQLITREHITRVSVECRIARRKTLMSESFKLEGVVTVEEVGYGEFSLLLERYETGAFRQLADDSAAVFLGTPLYFGVNLTAASTNLTLWTENCWATPYADPMSGGNYTIIREGCADDDTVVFYNYYGPQFTGFKVDAFSFIGDYTEVFVHCSVLICDSSDPWSRCAQGCEQLSRIKRSDHPAGSHSTPHIISTGPLSLSQPKGDDTSTENANPMTIAAIGSLIGLVVLLLLITMVTLMRTRHCTRSIDNCRLANEAPNERI